VLYKIEQYQMSSPGISQFTAIDGIGKRPPSNNGHAEVPAAEPFPVADDR